MTLDLVITVGLEGILFHPGISACSFSAIILITLVVVLDWSAQIGGILFSRTNCVFGSVHVGILALWVHPGDNIHGYIPLSILVLEGRVTVGR